MLAHSLLLAVVSAATDRTATVKSWADALDVKYTVVSNIKSDSSFDFKVTLKNGAPDAIDAAFPWCIYLTQDQAFKHEGANIGRKGADVGQGLTVSHVNGYLWKMCVNLNEDSTASNWTTLEQNKEKTWDLTGEGYINQDSTLYPRWFFACEDRCSNDVIVEDCCTPAIIKSTEKLTYNKPDFVSPFDTREKWLRSKNDKFEKKTPVQIYDDIGKVRPKDKRQYGLPILPQPTFVNASENSNQIVNGEEVPSAGTPIHVRRWNIDFKTNSGCRDITEDIEKAQSKWNGEDSDKSAFQINAGFYTSDQYEWYLGVSSSIVFSTRSCEGMEEGLRYILRLIEKLQNSKDAMLFNGNYYGNLPRYQTRSMMLDVSRNYHGIDSIKTLLNIMKELDMTQLHLRLTDDEGWRIEIDNVDDVQVDGKSVDFSKLTEIGGSRCFDPSGTECIMPQHGSGPEKDDGSGTGYISQKEYKELLKLGKEINIRIVPEIVAPSHSAAAISSMKSQLQLIDPDQNDDSQSVQGFYDNTINPCMEDSFVFLEAVVASIAKMHEDYMDIHNHFHIGGDEVNTEYFKTSPKCDELVKAGTIKSLDDLPVYFFQKYMKIVTDRAAFNIDGWEEVWEYERTDDNGNGIGLFAIHDPSIWKDYIREDTVLTAYHWNNMWQEYDTSSTGYMMANAGYNVILAPATHTYLDMANDPDPNSRGLMWATRYSDLVKTFSFRPDEMNNNGLWSTNGDKITTGCIDNQDGKDFKCTKLEKPENIVGLQGCMWSEELIEEEFMWSQIFPRLAAVAERGYKKAEWEDIYEDSSWDALEDKTFVEDFSSFLYSLRHFHQYLEKEGIPYHLPKPGARSNTSIRNLYIYNSNMYRKKGTDKWLTRDQFIKQEDPGDDTIVEIATTTLDRQNRWSYPIEMKWGYKAPDGGNGGGGGSGSATKNAVSLLAFFFLCLLH